MMKRELTRHNIDEIIVGKKYLYKGNGTVHDIYYYAEIVKKTTCHIVMKLTAKQDELRFVFGPANSYLKCATINGLGIDEHLYEYGEK